MGSLGVDSVELQTHGNLCRSHVRVVRARASEASALLIQERVEILDDLGCFLATPAYADRGSVTKASAEASGSRGPGLYMRQGDRRYMDEGYHHETR